MAKYTLTYKPFGAHAILVEWPSKIDENILNDILSFKTYLQNLELEETLQMKHAYNSLLVSYEFGIKKYYNRIEALETHYLAMVQGRITPRRRWNIPVCYDTKFVWDLHDLSDEMHMSFSEIIALHTQGLYTVYFTGFLPGFLYLGGLHEKLHFPRKSTPRLKVPKGAVAIGGHQTGIYPMTSPGGWNIIGQTPIELFDPKMSPPCFATAGDQIQFYAISEGDFETVKNAIVLGDFELESEVLHA